MLLLLELVPVVGSAQLLDQVLPLALSYGEVNEPVASRVVCCRLLGAMTPHLVGVCLGTVHASSWQHWAAKGRDLQPDLKPGVA